MRIFEAILILLNLLSLFLIVKEQSRTVWFRLAGANLSVLLIHGLFEGMRYQMAFPYIFVGLLTVFTCLKGGRKFNVKMPKAVKVMAISLSFVFLQASPWICFPSYID